MHQHCKRHNNYYAPKELAAKVNFDAGDDGLLAFMFFKGCFDTQNISFQLKFARFTQLTAKKRFFDALNTIFAEC